MSHSETLPTPPQLIKTMVAGFDIITNHISLILFPLFLDLFIWFGPRLRLRILINQLVNDFVTQSLSISPDMDTTQMIQSAQELWRLVGEQFNLLVALRSYPVGIPSLMASIFPLETPTGLPAFIDLESLGSVAGFYLMLTFVGLVLGTFYFSSVAQAAISTSFHWKRILVDWPRSVIQVFLLALTWFFLLLAVSIPASCIISLAALGSIAFGQCAVLLYAGFLMWLIFPLLFSAHGIFVNQQKVWASIKQGIHITRLTLPTTSLFFISVILLSQGLNILWRMPPNNSWLMLIGLAGHAFVATGLLSASFIYYRDADRWVRALQDESLQRIKLQDPQ